MSSRNRTNNIKTLLRVTGSPRRGRSDSEGPKKRSTPVTDPFVGEGAERTPVSLGNSFFCFALMSGRGSRIRKSVLARATQEIAILNPTYPCP